MANTSTSTRDQQLAVMAFGEHRLAVPLSDVTTIERTKQLQTDSASAPGQAFGTLSYRGRSYRVYGFSPEFALLAEMPTEWAFCACMGGTEDSPGLAIACEAVTPIHLGSEAVTQPMPAFIRRADSPLHTLIKQNEQLMLLSSATALVAFINGMETSKQ